MAKKKILMVCEAFGGGVYRCHEEKYIAFYNDVIAGKY